MTQAFTSIDPGVSYFAYAKWRCDLLVDAGMQCIDEYRETRYHDKLVIEKQQVYRNGKARVSDIVDLAISAGRIRDRFGEAKWYLPAEWKGQAPKKTHQKYILSRLASGELHVLSRFNKGQLEQILDAVGIGLYHLGRL